MILVLCARWQQHSPCAHHAQNACCCGGRPCQILLLLLPPGAPGQDARQGQHKACSATTAPTIHISALHISGGRVMQTVMQCALQEMIIVMDPKALTALAGPASKRWQGSGKTGTYLLLFLLLCLPLLLEGLLNLFLPQFGLQQLVCRVCAAASGSQRRQMAESQQTHQVCMASHASQCNQLHQLHQLLISTIPL